VRRSWFIHAGEQGDGFGQRLLFAPFRSGTECEHLFGMAPLHGGDGLLSPQFSLGKERSMDFSDVLGVLLFQDEGITCGLLDDGPALFVGARNHSFRLSLSIQ
jgi:hypothetical protein